MARRPASRARRTLLWTTALVAVLVLGLAAAVQFGTASLKPKLALDLAGGTEIILTPQVRPGQGRITDQTIADAITIIRERVDSNGSTEAEVSSQGGRNIVVDLPGDIASQRNAVKLVSQSAQMSFRPVLVEASTKSSSSSTASSSASATGTSSGASTGAATSGATGSASSTATAAPSSSTAGDRVPQALRATPSATAAAASSTADPSASASATSSSTSSATASSTASSTASADAGTGTPSDLAQITPAIAAAFEGLDCSDPVKVGTSRADDPKKPLVTCSTDGALKYVLGPVEVAGTQIKTATAGLDTTSTGATTNTWVVNLALDGTGKKAFSTSSTRLYTLTSPRNQFAIVLDGTVVESPYISTPITDGNARISGTFTQKSATTLANQLKFGALPISFKVQTTDQISALLGSQQLHRGLLAGLIGLLLVVLYSLAQYRVLGLVTVGSLALAGIFNFLAIDLLSWYQGYRLSLAGVAGFIVSIGITADSFIVFFERVRDEVREGRSLTSAVENGWARARRTILISDAVNFLAAGILYFLAIGNVRGFAFTLGLTTIIDLVIVIGFTHPVVVLLAQRRFFASGHRLSGFDAEHLGRSVAYAGRGRVRTPAERGGASAVGASAPTGTIAERRAAREAVTTPASPPDDPSTSPER